MKKVKPAALFLAASLFTISLAGCSNGGQSSSGSSQSTGGGSSQSAEGSSQKAKDPVTIKFSWWGDKSRHDGTLAAVQLWNDAHPEIQVETYFSGWDDYHPKLETQFASRTAPDAYQFSFQLLSQYVSQGQLLDLSPYVDADFADIDESLWNGTSIDGVPYGVAAGANANVLAFNKTKLSALNVPLPTDEETWDSLFEKCKAATQDTDGDGKVDFWGVQSLIDTPIEFYPMYLRQNGLEAWTDDGMGSNFGTPEVLEALKVWDGFREQGVCAPNDVTLPEGLSYLTAGYTGFAITTLSAFLSWQDQTTDELDIVAYPTVAGGTEAREMMTALPIGIYSNSAHPKETALFLSWLLTDPEAAKTSGMIRGIFPSTPQREATAEGMSPTQQQVMRVANYTSALGVHKGYSNPLHLSEFNDIWTQEVGRYNYGQVTLEEFLQNIAKTADPVLAQE